MWILALFATLASHSPGSASLPLDPASFTSPDGSFELHVDPNERFGRGSARYRMSSHCGAVWAREFPFTLCEVRVTDEGETVGYSVQLDTFVVAWIDATGEPRFAQTIEPQVYPVCMNPYPQPCGIELDAECEQLWLRARVSGRGYEWWLFRPPTGRLPEIPDGVRPPRTKPERRRRVRTPKAPPIPTIELTPFGVTQLEAPLMFSARGAGRILADGRICLQDHETGALFVWDETGARTLTGVSVPFENYSLNARRIATGPDGSIWAERRFGRYVGWSAEGHSLGEIDVDPEFDGTFDRLWFEPAGSMRWVARHDRVLMRLDPQGVEVERIERRPDGRWLRGVHDLLFLEGTLVALDESSKDVPAQIVIRPHAGHPTAIELPRGAPGNQLHVTPNWWLTASVLPQALLVRREPVASTESLRRTAVEPIQPEAFLIDLKDLRDDSVWAFGFSPDGEQLLALERESLRLYRFLLP